jgi:hypothetical protein
MNDTAKAGFIILAIAAIAALVAYVYIQTIT